MLVYTKNRDYVHVNFIIMEMFDRTWSASDIFRDEYFTTEELAYDAIIARGDKNRMYCLVPTVAVFNLGYESQN